MKKEILDEKDWLYVAQHYGRGMGATEIAEHLGTTKQRVQQISAILRKSGLDIPKMKEKGLLAKKIDFVKTHFNENPTS